MIQTRAESATEPAVPALPAGFNKLHIYFGRFFPSQQQVVSVQPHLQRSTENAAPHKLALGTHGQAHIGKPAAYFLASEDGFDSKTVVRMQQ